MSKCFLLECILIMKNYVWYSVVRTMNLKLLVTHVGSFVTFLYPSSVVESIIASDKANMCCNRLINF